MVSELNLNEEFESGLPATRCSDHQSSITNSPFIPALPTYPTVLGQKGDTFDLRKWEDMMKGSMPAVPGVKINPTMVLDGGRDLEWFVDFCVIVLIVN